ncbi:hypothetical protein TA3x_000375 [Tundrisphaera sp. TA3]|uniref:hypothetical protein n=1 Tax=Tundrisphaera sp. TA3 TaxID=3435775 RepID=UPI003EB9054C
MPRKSRKSQPESPAGLASTEPATSQLPEPTPAPSQEAPPAEPAQAPPEPGLAHRPAAPRLRSPHEPRNVFSGVEAGFKLDQTPEERIFRFAEDRKPSAEEKAELGQMGFQYRPGVKRWAAPATPEVREGSDRFALKLAGKAQKLGYER